MEIKKLGMESENLLIDNIEYIKNRFPNAIDENDGQYKIDFDILKQELSNDIVDDKKERYELTWPGKRKAILDVNTPTTKTLRPINKKSVNFDSTNNIYIEGDNLEVLKILQGSYLRKIKFIYIDPPYNTGNDFIYKDNFKKNSLEDGQESGNIDENENRLVVNQQTNGRFHSDWLSMIYPRLKLARNLLRDDGVIFISIDDNEVFNLRKICNEIFSETNLVAEIPWQSRASIQNDTDFSVNHEYILCYAKNRRNENRRLKETNANEWYKKDSFVCRPLPLDISKFSNSDNDPRGIWKADPFDAPNVRPNLTYTIENPNTGEEFLPPAGRHWRMEKSKYLKYLKDNRIIFGKDGKGRPQLKVFYSEKKDYGSIENSWFSAEKIGTTTNGTKELMKLFDGKNYFDMPKPVSLINKLLFIANVSKNDIILDFFSGSATTADAVMQYNVKNNTNLKFILVQLPEKIALNSSARHEGFSTICDIGEERIKRAGKKIKDETNADIDYGFRVYKIDSSNMKDVYYEPDKLNQNFLEQYESNVKEDRTPEDLLTQIILDLGLTLDLKVEEKEILNNKVYYVGGNSLVACLDKEIDINIIPTICECKPLKVVFKENGFNSDSDKINTFEKIKELSPDTETSVL